MKPHDVLHVQLVDSSGQSIRLENISISIGFFLHGNRRYGFRLGPTNEDGYLCVTYRDVEERRLLSLEAQPWDYKTRLDECDALVLLSVPPQDELDEAVHIATLFNMGVVPPDAEQWARANNRCISCEPVEVVLVGGPVAASIRCKLNPDGPTPSTK